MKYVLLVLFVKDLVVSPPWAAALSAEFDDLEACQAAIVRLKKAEQAPLNAKVIAGCAPKASQ
jgi:hypothetical protein